MYLHYIRLCNLLHQCIYIMAGYVTWQHNLFCQCELHYNVIVLCQWYLHYLCYPVNCVLFSYVSYICLPIMHYGWSYSYCWGNDFSIFYIVLWFVWINSFTSMKDISVLTNASPYFVKYSQFALIPIVWLLMQCTLLVRLWQELHRRIASKISYYTFS